MGQEDTFQRTSIPLAQGICAECLQSQYPKTGNRTLIMVYCEHNQAAAVMHSKHGALTGQWLILTPVSAGEWTERVTNGMIPRLLD